MTNKFFLGLVAALIILAIGFTGCSDDEAQPEATKVYGTITFENADTWEIWVDSGEVQVTIFPEFSLDPPAGWGEVPDDFFGPGIPGGTFALGAPYNSQNPVVLNYVSGQTEYEYEIEVEAGTYSALAVGFRHDFVNDPSLRSATLGVHWGNAGQVSHGIVIDPFFNYPPPVTFEVADGEQKEINFKADFDFVKLWYQ